MGDRTIPGLARCWPLIPALVMAGCGGGGGSAPAPAPTPPPPPPAPSNVTISGTITYDYVPGGIGGLDYDATEERPVRLSSVQFIEQGTAAVLAASVTDENGDYSLTVPASRNGFVRVRAESIQTGTPGWNFQVRNNTGGDAIYSLDGSNASSGTGNSTRDLHAESGWTGSDYGEPRAAAPFSILDAILTGAQFIQAAEAVAMPPLDIHWSPENVAEFNDDGEPDPEAGLVGTSFYGVNPALGLDGIYLLGMEDEDTEEYDWHVVIHEFGHYLERQLARSDSIGGPHGFGDYLDIRVAFSEGWATAYAALALDDPAYIDTGMGQQSQVFTFNVEGPHPLLPNSAPGWFSEESVWEIVYDVVDTGIDGGADNLSLPFADVWSVKREDMVTTNAVTSIFPFLNGLKANLDAGNASLVDDLAIDQAIGTITTDFGAGALDNLDPMNSADVFPIFAELTVDGPAVNVCSTDDFTGGNTGSTNKLGSRRFLTFTPLANGPVGIRVEATEIPANEYADPDFIVHRQGPLYISNSAPSAECQDLASGSGSVGDCFEQAASAVNLPIELHVLEVYEWTNTNDAELNPDFAPIGRTCFDVTATQL